MMETAQIYINKLIGEQNFVCTYNGILCKHKRGEVPIHATINLKTYAKSKKPHQKSYTYCDFTYMKYPGQVKCIEIEH